MPTRHRKYIDILYLQKNVLNILLILVSERLLLNVSDILFLLTTLLIHGAFYEIGSFLLSTHLFNSNALTEFNSIFFLFI